MKTRLLTQADYSAYEAFLRRHAATSMFLRSNARQAGLDFQGKDYQAHYFGAFEGDNLRGVIALCWNGSVLPQAPETLDALIDHAKREMPDFRVNALSGPGPQVRALVARINPAESDIAISRAEDTYHLRLADMVVPKQLQRGWHVRRAEERDAETMARRQVIFASEGLNAPINDEALARARADIGRWIGERRGFVLEADGQVVAQCAFNGQLPDTVQVGGVFTPPELRRHGYARGLVAGALRIAREEGVSETLLFTQNPFAARAYEAIGYRRVADFHLTLLREGKLLREIR